MKGLLSIIFGLTVWLVLSASALAQISSVPKMTDEALEFNNVIILDILKRDIDTVLSKSLPEFQEMEDAKLNLEKFMTYLPLYEEGASYDPFTTQIPVVEVNGVPKAIYGTRYEITNLNNKGEFTDEWAIVDIYSQETPEGLKLRLFNFKTQPFQPSKVGKFEIKNKSIKHYIFFVLLIAMPLFTIITIITIIRNKHMKKKWLWGLFSGVGLWGVNFNWFTSKITPEFISLTSNADGTTGWHVKLISFKLLGASFLKASQYSPYIVTISFPLGAILYWALKHRNKTVSKGSE